MIAAQAQAETENESGKQEGWKLCFKHKLTAMTSVSLASETWRASSLSNLLFAPLMRMVPYRRVQGRPEAWQYRKYLPCFRFSRSSCIDCFSSSCLQCYTTSDQAKLHQPASLCARPPLLYPVLPFSLCFWCAHHLVARASCNSLVKSPYTLPCSSCQPLCADCLVLYYYHINLNGERSE